MDPGSRRRRVRDDGLRLLLNNLIALARFEVVAGLKAVQDAEALLAVFLEGHARGQGLNRVRRACFDDADAQRLELARLFARHAREALDRLVEAGMARVEIVRG